MVWSAQPDLTKAVRNVTEASSSGNGAAPILAGHARYLAGVAGRAPSLHNTQPWRFTVSGDAVELRADVGRQLTCDPDGREMLISCGAALYGLRLAVRSLGYLPAVEILPGRAAQRPLARLYLGPAAPATAAEKKMLAAVPHRHTHRGPFEAGPLPAGLFGRLRDDVRAEGATLSEVTAGPALRQLTEVIAAVGRRQDSDPLVRAEVSRWSHGVADPARDGVPAHAFHAEPNLLHARLPQRDFDLGRGLGLSPADGPEPPVTAVLFTAGDSERDWLQAGQALHRMLLRAATEWVFARLNTQPLEHPMARTLIRDGLELPGEPQMLLALGLSRTAHVTARRPVADVIEP